MAVFPALGQWDKYRFRMAGRGLRLFRSVWGTPFATSPRKVAARAAAQGYTGLEASLGDLQHAGRDATTMLTEYKLRLVAGRMCLRTV